MKCKNLCSNRNILFYFAFIIIPQHNKFIVTCVSQIFGPAMQNPDNEGKNICLLMRQRFRVCSSPQCLYMSSGRCSIQQRPAASSHLLHRDPTHTPSTYPACRLRSTTAEVTPACSLFTDARLTLWQFYLRKVTFTEQVRSWWTTSQSTWGPSGTGGWFQMSNQVTWRSFSPALLLSSRTTGRISSTT